MADFAKLKVAEKGTPPSASDTTANLAQPPREGEEKMRLEFGVPESVFNAFSDEAARMFGRKRGSKLQLFMHLWAEHQNRLRG